MSKGIEKLREEYQKIRQSGDLASIGGSVELINQDFLHWKGSMLGPKNSPYSGGCFFLK